MSSQVSVRNSDVQASNSGTQGGARALRVVAPPVDIFENADEILVVADVPGAAGEAIDVRVENDTLTLKTKRAAAHEPRALGREYEEFDYARSFRLPRGIDGANIRAEARDGTVVVRLPKSAAVKPRKVPVSGGN
jgi:HSP20 family molecular chaperone IbpA